jgi:hypothetical protein
MHLASILCAVAGAVVLGYVCWRVWVWTSSPTRFNEILPPSNYLSWWTTPTSHRPSLAKLGTPTTSNLGFASHAGRRESPTDKRLFADNEHVGVGAAASDGAIAGFHAAESLASIDTDVLQAIQASTTEHLHSLPSINDYIHDHFFDSPTESAEGWLHRLEGYVAEQKAALALEQAGHTVEFAPHANQAGWDLLVDGHAVQIKEGITAAANTKEALLAHPDIPVYTDLRSAVEVSGPMVHGLPDLDHDAIVSATQDSLSGVPDALNPDFSIPVVTLLRSSWREIKLLCDGKTHIERAVKNVAIDTGGVGVGAWVGLKAGLAVGAAIPPAAGFFAISGAIAGAMTGRKFAKNIRMAPFKKALVEFRRTHGDAAAATDGAVVQSRTAFEDLARQCDRKFKAVRLAIEVAVQKELSEVECEMTLKLEQFLKDFPLHLSKLEAQLNTEETALLRQMPPSAWWNRFFPSQSDLQKSAIQHWFRSARKIVVEEKKKIESMSTSSVSELRREVERFLSTYRFTLKSLNDSLTMLEREFNEAQVTAGRLIDDATGRVEAERNVLLLQLRDDVFKIHSALVETFKFWKSRLEYCMGRLRREAEPLGIELPR